jgi:hypothetical protein
MGGIALVGPLAEVMPALLIDRGAVVPGSLLDIGKRLIALAI